MTPRLLVIAIAPVFASTTASAQAPGEVAPAQAPPAAPAPSTGGTSVMAHRFAIGLSVGGFGVAPQDAPDGSQTEFRIAELAVRYRVARRLELELAFGGGREVVDGEDGDLATGSVTLGLRYRLRPEQRWNWWLMAGFGGAVIAPHRSSAAERDGVQRPLGMLGVGLERRFDRFALQAEFRAIGLGPTDGGATKDVPVTTGALIPPAGSSASDRLDGGALTLGASYYF